MRALLDAAIRVNGKPLRVAIDDARRRGLIDLDRLLRRARGRRIRPARAS